MYLCFYLRVLVSALPKANFGHPCFNALRRALAVLLLLVFLVLLLFCFIC